MAQEQILFSYSWRTDSLTWGGTIDSKARRREMGLGDRFLIFIGEILNRFLLRITATNVLISLGSVPRYEDNEDCRVSTQKCERVIFQNFPFIFHINKEKRKTTHVAPPTKTSKVLAFVKLDSAMMSTTDAITIVAILSARLASVLMTMIGTRRATTIEQAISARAIASSNDTEKTETCGSREMSLQGWT